MQHQRSVEVMPGEFSTFRRKLLWNPLVRFLTSTGTTELQYASFTIQALYQKDPKGPLNLIHDLAHGSTAHRHQLFLSGPHTGLCQLHPCPGGTWVEWPRRVQVADIWMQSFHRLKPVNFHQNEGICINNHQPVSCKPKGTRVNWHTTTGGYDLPTIFTIGNCESLF